MPNTNYLAINMPYVKAPSYIAIKINNNNTTKRVYKPNKYNAHRINTNDPLWLEKEGVNTSYNHNVESRKRWLAKKATTYRKRKRSQRK
jgi:hypothetical protein